jgi:hypothetical protein
MLLGVLTHTCPDQHCVFNAETAMPLKAPTSQNKTPTVTDASSTSSRAPSETGSVFTATTLNTNARHRKTQDKREQADREEELGNIDSFLFCRARY